MMSEAAVPERPGEGGGSIVCFLRSDRAQAFSVENFAETVPDTIPGQHDSLKKP